jgi:ribosome maturation factor RimP
MNNINSELVKQIELIVEDKDMVLYDVVSVKVYDRNILRIIVMPKTKTDEDGNPISVDIDKCAQISRLVSPLLDVEEDGSGCIEDLYGYEDYTLEVSSPGIERKLKLPKHFKASIGEMLKVKDFNGDIVKGKLKSADDSEIVVETTHGDEIISYDEISSAKTYFQWHKGRK